MIGFAKLILEARTLAAAMRRSIGEPDNAVKPAEADQIVGRGFRLER